MPQYVFFFLSQLHCFYIKIKISFYIIIASKYRRGGRDVYFTNLKDITETWLQCAKKYFKKDLIL